MESTVFLWLTEIYFFLQCQQTVKQSGEIIGCCFDFRQILKSTTLDKISLDKQKFYFG